MLEYEIGLQILKYGLTSEFKTERHKPNSNSMEVEHKEVEKIVLEHKPEWRKVMTPDVRGVPVDSQLGSLQGKAKPVDHFDLGIKNFMRVYADYNKLVGILYQISTRLGGVNSKDVVEALDRLLNLKVLQKKKEEIQRLTEEIRIQDERIRKVEEDQKRTKAEQEKVQNQVYWSESEQTITKEKVYKSSTMVRNLKELVDQPAEAVVRS